MSDPQGEPATIMHRKHSLGQADIHRTRTVQAFGILHKKINNPHLTYPRRVSASGSPTGLERAPGVSAKSSGQRRYSEPQRYSAKIKTKGKGDASLTKISIPSEPALETP